ncbi:MAG: OmpH family outer membrane protein [Planctomycetia bacterium]
MLRSIATPVLLLALAAACVLPAPAAAAPAPMPVGVVDILELINAYPGTAQAQAELESAAKTAQAEFDVVKKEVAALEEKLKIEVAQGAPGRAAQEKVVAQKKMNAEFDLKWKVKVAQDAYMATLIRVHAEVVALVARHARENGFGLVLQMTKEKLSGKSPDELIPNIIVRTVAYWSPDLDITEAVKKSFPAAGGR